MLDTEIKVTPEVAAEHGLSGDEYARILKILGREPNITELGIFSVMWSEHCSYKSSKVHLKRLPVRGARVVQGPGENAGVVDIGDGLVAAFKIESHNHPSFVEPFQGAATGVGGILRDIFTMGARPIAVMDALRFGPITSGAEAPQSLATSSVAAKAATHKAAPTHSASAAAQSAGQGVVGRGFGPAESRSSISFSGASAPAVAPEVISRNRRILDGVISGIAHYGNCFGVPTVGGDVHFEPNYSSNPLVNALALGIARRDELFFARARGTGNPVIYVGAKTGRDGIHGASLLASAEFTEESQQKRPNVQVGDPFLEKLLLEACLEAMRTGAVVGIQDMGAAGLTCSTCEMGSRGGTGIEIELSKVPQRETAMTPYEIMLSESQERMLLVAEGGREHEVLDVFAKWGLDAVIIGRVTDGGLLRVLLNGKAVAEIPAHPLAEEGPVYSRPLRKPESRKDERLVEFAAEPVADLTHNFKKLLAAPGIASKRWIFEQYDTMVRTNTLVGPGAGDSAVLRVKESKHALALSTDCNGRWCRLDPRIGAIHAVAEAARNVACSGARPIAVTNCLNFGNPEKPEVMWQFSQTIDGLAEACNAFETPVTGGNVSFYNETLGRAIDPTPMIGMLGLLDDASHALGMGFRNEGDVVLLLMGYEERAKIREATAANTPAAREAFQAALRSAEPEGPPPGETIEELRRQFSSSEYARTIQGIEAGTPPRIDLAAEKRVIDVLVRLAGQGLLRSAHDVSDGGIAVTLAECCFASSPSGAKAPAGSGANVAAEAATHNPLLGVEVGFAGRVPPEVALFGELGGRVVVSCAPDAVARVQEIAREYTVAARRMGRVTPGPALRIVYNDKAVIQADVESLRDPWANALERALKAQ